jgi:hypothetical protein
LDLSGNKITEEGARAVSAMLQMNSSLISLDFWGNDIGWDGIDAIIASMQTNTTLQEFRHHYAHYDIEEWNKNKNEWVEISDYVKRASQATEEKKLTSPKLEVKAKGLGQSSFFCS